ncbi:c-type cytochrome domain-containing protein [Zobellia alginiliquefaciens]|uniref:c-type cytochrome domain-containing protein n=1 Tax=Zobellia alginiliquefaciens TaxID=3032586 RepID=UPI0023E250D4|nr:c-type cytochrome domain-containing protein [Zobellia alginiliquefaciens]
MDVLKQLLGRLHPLVVHLPIGFIMMGLLLQWYDRKKKKYNTVISLIYLWAGITATLACITGYLQYLGEGYAFDTVKWHLWSGIATALFSFLMYAKLKGILTLSFLLKLPMLGLSIFFFMLISFTGHQGGNITHGEEYLIEPLPNALKSALGFETFEEKKIDLNEDNWQEALLYEDVIKPILNNKCASCHNPKKTKGELLLTTQAGILNGGENGAIIEDSKASESELYTRLVLPVDDDDHMPPEGKTQLLKEEIQLVMAWIDAGNPFDKTISESGLEKSLFLSFFPKKEGFDHPNIEIEAASKTQIKTIEASGIHIDQISNASNFLSASCINKPGFTDSDFDMLMPIKNQISRLDLGNTKITDAVFYKLAELPNLTILLLDNTAITGKNLQSLVGLEHLKSINLTSTTLKAAYLKAFNDFKNLQFLYLHGTNATPQNVKINNNNIHIDFGNYTLPTIPSDTIVY